MRTIFSKRTILYLLYVGELVNYSCLFTTLIFFEFLCLLLNLIEFSLNFSIGSSVSKSYRQVQRRWDKAVILLFSIILAVPSNQRNKHFP